MRTFQTDRERDFFFPGSFAFLLDEVSDLLRDSLVNS